MGCGRFVHKSQVCRSKPQHPEPVKKTSDDKKKRKFKKKKTKKENAKRVAELQEFVQTLTLNSTLISSEDESSDSDSSSSLAVNRVQLQQPQAPHTRRERRANAYAEISDTEVINSLNRTEMASIIKIKKAKTARGMSYTDGMVSNRLNFRSARIERLLLDSGAQVNIVSEAIARDAKVKIIKLKYERFVAEASV